MDLVNEILLRSGLWTRNHLGNLALALIATLLVIYGDSINRLLKRLLKPYPRVLRLLGFVLMCVFGYGALTVFFTPVLAGWLGQIPTPWLALSMLGLFLCVGWLAERKHQV